ncbi:MAG: TlpA family protein disulfide reductase [Rubrivivax sp.]|nr:TlpA family protein disulfide reductase [Rubrivivax sp.]
MNAGPAAAGILPDEARGSPRAPFGRPDTTRRHALGAAAQMLALGAAAWLPTPALATAAKPGDSVAWPELRLLGGGRWGPREAAGQAVIVVFWSLNCPYCVRHNAHLTRLQRSKAALPLQILGVVRENDPAGTRRHMARHGHEFPLTLDWEPLAARLSPRRITPLTVTVDRQGRLLQQIPGEMAEDDVLALASLAR